jgi:hypothetical protein
MMNDNPRVQARAETETLKVIPTMDANLNVQAQVETGMMRAPIASTLARHTSLRVQAAIKASTLAKPTNLRVQPQVKTRMMKARNSKVPTETPSLGAQTQVETEVTGAMIPPMTPMRTNTAPRS